LCLWAYKTVIYEVKNHLAWVTLNQPEAENHISEEMAQELDNICDGINQDNDVYAVVLTASGGKAFCTGSDITSEQCWYHPSASIAGIDRPVIGAINGDALGEGLELALSCDIRIASDKAYFGFPQVASGRIPVDGGTQRLPRIVGKAKALEMILTAEIIDAAEALSAGLVNRVVSNENLFAEVESLAGTITSTAPISLRFAKEAVSKGMDLTLEQGLRLEADLYLLLHTTDDRTEGITSFLEKRPPRFKGQ